jgi:cell division protein FtsI/penicillin-binding protein 2
MIRKFLLLSFTLGSSLLFIFQLTTLQLFNSDYTERSLNNAVQKRPIYPTRGLIYDRNGTLWVANKPVYDLMVVPENLNAFDTLELSKSLKITKKTLLTQIQEAKRFSRKLPSVVMRQLSLAEVGILQEKMWKYPGFYFQKKSTRDYLLPIGANVLGYTSETNQDEIKTKSDYDLGEMIGRQGIEKTYEEVLRGTKGEQLFQKDRFNRIIGAYEGGAYDKASEAAEDITLSLDAVLQAYGESLMNNKRGGIVALEPESGEVLALITAPNYNPNLLVGRDRSKFFNKLVQDTLAKPLFDRSLQAEYSPGSPFKTLNALIGLQENVITPETIFACNEGHFYARGAFMGCHCRVGTNSDLKKGEILTTPIQMANFTATIANRGYYRKPHFKKTNSLQERDSLYPINQTSIDTQHFETVIEGMHQVVEKGTARIARIKGIEVCGKTGTVENFIRLNGEKTQLTDHSIFVAFAPKDDPKIAVAVFIENGYWGARWAAPIASLMIEKYLNGEVKRGWLENRMLEGSLQSEYEKPLLGKAFTINE